MLLCSWSTRSLQLITVLILGGFLILGVGCQNTPGDGMGSNNPETVATPTNEPSQTPTRLAITPTLTATTIAEDGSLVLTFWTVEQVSPLAGEELGAFFSGNIRNFERADPNIKVDILIKKSSGKGGVLDFLKTAREVAPSVLPDVVVMSPTDLDQAFADNLIQPLDGRLDRSIVQDLLPAARRMGTVDDKLVGVPIGLEMEHAVYHRLVFTETPVLWQDVLSKNTTYLFPAKGINGLVNDVTLSQYFSAGGEFLSDQGAPGINDRVFRDVLGFYQQARENGIIDASILEAAITEELWPAYLEGKAGLAQISVRQYLTDRETLNNTDFSPLPVHDRANTPAPVVRGWVLALTTSDISRQDAALRLIETFLSTANNAEWNSINRSIPVRDTAYQQLAGDDPYWIFLTNQLNTARPEPHFPQYDRIGRIMQQAVEQVIRGEATADEATETAIDALAQ